MNTWQFQIRYGATPRSWSCFALSQFHYLDVCHLSRYLRILRLGSEVHPGDDPNDPLWNWRSSKQHFLRTNINRRLYSVRLNNLSDVYCIQLTCLTTGEEPLCLAVEIGRNARRRRRARRRMLKSWTACSFLPSTDMPNTCFLFGLEATSFSHCKLSSIQTISLGVLFWKYNIILSLWHKRL